MAAFFWCPFLLLLASNPLAILGLAHILPGNQPHLSPLSEDLNSNTSAAVTLFDLSSPQANDVIDYRIPNTPTTIRFNLQPDPIEPQDMARTILQTQVKLRGYIATHYQAANDVLFFNDDPYISEPRFAGCFLGVAHWPPDRQKRLTYGMVDNVLKGIWEFLYRGGRFIAADFFVVDEDLGTLGIGTVRKYRPGQNVRNVTEG